MKLVRFSIALILAGIAVCGVTAIKPASAQVPVLGGPAEVVVGDFIPTETNARHFGGSNQLSLEARYALPSPPLVPLKTMLSAGVEEGGANGGHSTIVPLTVAEYLGSGGLNPLHFKSLYAGVGVGAYLIDETGHTSAGRFGGFAAVGYNTPIAVFVEAKYQIVEYGDGVTLSVGAHF